MLIEDDAPTHTLRGVGFDASEDGTGRGTPLTVEDDLSPCGCHWDYMDAGGFCACCQAHIDDPDGFYALQGDGTHNFQRCPSFSDVAAFAENQRGEVLEKETADSLKVGGGKPGQGYPAARVGASVRRLTPTECERLMGWPDGWTILDDTDEPNPLPDGRRYAACGDGVVAPVAEWIGRRLIGHL